MAGHHHHHAHQRHHNHHHGGQGEDQSLARIRLALALNLSFAIVELVGGLLSQSVAVLSDALHDFGDSLSLLFAYLLERRAKDASNVKFSYGMRRLSLLSALITGAVLLLGSAFILYQAIPKLWNPTTPNTTGMMLLALLGIAVNGYAASRTRRGATMNERVVTWHLMEDLLGWVGIFIVSIVMKFVDLPILDPLTAIVFTCYILWGASKNIRQTMRLFLQGTPDTLSSQEISEKISHIPGVKGVHDVHLWSLDGDNHVLTVHAVVAQNATMSDAEEVRNQIKILTSQLGKIHTTVEIETNPDACTQSQCAGGP